MASSDKLPTILSIEVVVEVIMVLGDRIFSALEQASNFQGLLIKSNSVSFAREI